MALAAFDLLALSQQEAPPRNRATTARCAFNPSPLSPWWLVKYGIGDETGYPRLILRAVSEDASG